MELEAVKIKKPQDVNVVIGQSHFIKTVEDLYETVKNGVPGIEFGLAFVESSGECKVRVEGNDPELKELASENALRIGAGHCFILFIKNAFPINILNAVKAVPEVCNIYCATANSVDVIIADTGEGRGILGVVDGSKPKGIENKEDVEWRHNFLRTIGYKL